MNIEVRERRKAEKCFALLGSISGKGRVRHWRDRLPGAGCRPCRSAPRADHGGATKVTVGCRLLVDRPPQVQRLDDTGRAQVEVLVDQFQDFLVRNFAGAVGFDHQADRFGDPDGVADLQLYPVGQTSRDDVLGNIADGVSGRAVNLRRVFAAERAATVPGNPTVGVHDNLAAGQTGIAHRATDHEAAGRVDEELGVLVDQFGRNDRPDHFLNHVLAIWSWVTSGACWVETTIASTRFGLPKAYSTVTWLLPSGRR